MNRIMLTLLLTFSFAASASNVIQWPVRSKNFESLSRSLEAVATADSCSNKLLGTTPLMRLKGIAAKIETVDSGVALNAYLKLKKMNESGLLDEMLSVIEMNLSYLASYNNKSLESLVLPYLKHYFYALNSPNVSLNDKSLTTAQRLQLLTGVERMIKAQLRLNSFFELPEANIGDDKKMFDLLSNYQLTLVPVEDVEPLTVESYKNVKLRGIAELLGGLENIETNTRAVTTKDVLIELNRLKEYMQQFPKERGNYLVDIMWGLASFWWEVRPIVERTEKNIDAEYTRALIIKTIALTMQKPELHEQIESTLRHFLDAQYDHFFAFRKVDVGYSQGSVNLYVRILGKVEGNAQKALEELNSLKP